MQEALKRGLQQSIGQKARTAPHKRMIHRRQAKQWCTKLSSAVSNNPLGKRHKQHRTNEGNSPKLLKHARSTRASDENRISISSDGHHTRTEKVFHPANQSSRQGQWIHQKAKQVNHQTNLKKPSDASNQQTMKEIRNDFNHDYTMIEIDTELT